MSKPMSRSLCSLIKNWGSIESNKMIKMYPLTLLNHLKTIILIKMLNNLTTHPILLRINPTPLTVPTKHKTPHKIKNKEMQITKKTQKTNWIHNKMKSSLITAPGIRTILMANLIWTMTKIHYRVSIQPIRQIKQITRINLRLDLTRELNNIREQHSNKNNKTNLISIPSI